MKKHHRPHTGGLHPALFVLLTFLVYFLTVSFVVTCCFLLFFSGMGVEAAQVRHAAVYTFVNVLFLSFLFTAIDLIRRRVTVERPVRAIRAALDRVMQGDFAVRLDTSGTPYRFRGIMESINRMTEELSGVETLRTDFTTNVSHELKTPLAVIRNYAVLLSSEDLTSAERIEYARAIEDGCRRLSELVTNVLRLSRLEQQQIYPDVKEFDLSEQLCAVLLGFESVWEQKEIAISANVAQGVTVRADAELLALIWNNLLSNAFKFTDRGGTVSLSLTLSESGEYAVVRVSDTGCGMTPETGAHIFEKFYQGDPSHRAEGNGLGLALVRRVIDILHGEICVESAVGKGSTFTVRIRR